MSTMYSSPIFAFAGSSVFKLDWTATRRVPAARAGPANISSAPANSATAEMTIFRILALPPLRRMSALRFDAASPSDFVQPEIIHNHEFARSFGFFERAARFLLMILVKNGRFLTCPTDLSRVGRSGLIIRGSRDPGLFLRWSPTPERKVRVCPCQVR